MALRLFLVAVVASLALDLPNGGTLSKSVRSGRSWLDARVTGPVPGVRRDVVVLSEPKASECKASQVACVAGEAPKPEVVAVEPKAPEAVITRAATVEPTVEDVTAAPILPGRIEAAFVAIAATEPAPEAPPAPTPVPVDVLADLLAGPDPAAVPTIVAEAPKSVPAPIVSVEQAAAPTEPVVVVESEPKPVDLDGAFTSVVGAMATEFAADVPTIAATEPDAKLATVEDAPAPVSAPALAAEEVVVGEDLYPGMAYALNREAEGLNATIDENETVRIAPRAELAPVVETADDSLRAERLANAVKLTGQAVHAWASLLAQRPSVTSIQR